MSARACRRRILAWWPLRGGYHARDAGRSARTAGGGPIPSRVSPAHRGLGGSSRPPRPHPFGRPTQDPPRESEGTGRIGRDDGGVVRGAGGSRTRTGSSGGSGSHRGIFSRGNRPRSRAGSRRGGPATGLEGRNHGSRRRGPNGANIAIRARAAIIPSRFARNAPPLLIGARVRPGRARLSDRGEPLPAYLLSDESRGQAAADFSGGRSPPRDGHLAGISRRRVHAPMRRSSRSAASLDLMRWL